jgi:ankyrin repeat protein
MRDPERRDDNLLHEYARRGLIDEIKQKISSLEESEKIKLLNAKDISGDTILHIATKRMNVELVNFLMGENVNLNIYDANKKFASKSIIEDYDKIFAEDPCSPQLDSLLEISTLFLQKRFFDAILQNNKKFIESNLNFVNSKNIKGITPLHIASACGNKNIVDFLLRNEANVYDRDNEGMTALHYGAMSGSIDVVNSLMLADSDVKALNVREETPLMLFKVPESQADIDKVRPARDIIARNRVAIELALKPAFYQDKSGRH